MTETDHGLASPEATLRRGAQHLAQLHPDLDPRLVERVVFESHATLAGRWRQKSWASARMHQHTLAPLPSGTYPGVDDAELYAFLERHAPVI